MKRATMLVILAAATAGAADWPQEPTGYKSVPWGTTYAEWEKAPASKQGEARVLVAGGRKMKIDKSRVLDIDGVRLVENWIFGELRLEMVEWSPIDADRYPTLLASLVARYGEPHSVRRYQVKNLLGATLDGVDADWVGPNAEVHAVQYWRDKMTESHVEIGTATYFQRKRAERPAPTKF
jgi:hypothetical protein